MNRLSQVSNFTEICEKHNIDTYRVICVDDWLDGTAPCNPTIKQLIDWCQFYIVYWNNSCQGDERLVKVVAMLLKRI